MKIHLMISVVFTIGFLVCCKVINHKVDPISMLDSYEKQKVFLENLHDKDQYVRNAEEIANSKYGYNSPQHISAWDSIELIDDRNLEDIERYLSLYGHPSLLTHGQKATNTPFIVIHHAKTIHPRKNVDTRKANFHYIYSAVFTRRSR